MTFLFRIYIIFYPVVFFLIFNTGCSRKSDTISSPLNSSKPAITEDISQNTHTITTTAPSPETGSSISIPANLKPGGLLGEYFVWREHTNYFTGRPVFSRVDNEIGFNWEVYAADSRLPDNRFSVRWTGYLKIDEEGDYRFRLDADNGAQLSIGDKQIFPMSMFSRRETIYLTKGLHKITLEYYEEEGVALCYLFWSEPPYRLTSLIPSDHLFYEEPITTSRPLSPRTLSQ